MGNSVKRDIRESERAEVAARVFRLRIAGATWQEIADAMGFRHLSIPFRMMQRRLRQIVAEPALQLVEIENQRLDALQAAVWPKAMAGSVRHVEAAVRISDSRRRLNGLDAPAKITLGVGAEIEAFLDRVKAAVPSAVYEQLLTLAATSPSTREPN